MKRIIKRPFDRNKNNDDYDAGVPLSTAEEPLQLTGPL